MADRADEAKPRAEDEPRENDGPQKDHPKDDPAENDQAGERRRSGRFACGGEVKISRLPSDGIFLPGKIIDLSLQGCRVDTAVPIDCGARAEIVLRVNSTPFRAVGEVRQFRDGWGLGIEFVQLSHSGRDILSDLVRELAKLQAAMAKLRKERRETGAESFRAQLEGGKLLAEHLNKRFAALGAALGSEGSQAHSKDSRRAAPGDNEHKRISSGTETPLVIAVDLFG